MQLKCLEQVNLTLSKYKVNIILYIQFICEILNVMYRTKMVTKIDGICVNLRSYI